MHEKFLKKPSHRVYIYIYIRLRSHLKSITHPTAFLTLFIFSVSCNSSLKVRTAKRSQSASGDFKIVNVNAKSLDQSTFSTNISWTNPSSKASYVEIVFTNDSACKDEIVGSLTVKPQLQEIKNIKANQFRYVCLFALDSNNKRIFEAANNPYEIKAPSPTSSPTTSPEVSVSPSNSAAPTATPSPSSVSNTAPILSFVEPKGNNDTIAQNESFNITWTDADPDDDATISLYYKTSASGACSTGTLITSGISENADGTNGSYSWNTNGITPSTYYICARIEDGTNPALDVWSDSLYINTAPTFSWVLPVSAGSSGSFYYKQDDNSGACTSGTAITSGISENSATNTYNWDLSAAISHYYYICARIEDSINAPVDVWSQRYHLYRECVWTGALDNDWGNAGNWSNCNSSAPTAYDKVVIPSGGTPVVSASTTIHNFEGPATGGGIVTVNANRSLSLNKTDSKILSDITFQGDSATCTNCIVSGNGWSSFSILNNAHLTLLSGITLVTIGTLKVGDGNSNGHLVVNQGAQPSNEWPLILRDNNQGTFISVAGTSGQNSTLQLNGVKISANDNANYAGTTSAHYLEFASYSTLINLDNIDFSGTSQAYYTNGSAIVFGSACNLISINDTTWDNINFGVGVFAANAGWWNSVYFPANCATNVTINNPTGSAASSIFANDPGSLLTWNGGATSQSCVWNGSTNTDWFTAANWSSCGARSGTPDVFDTVEIPSGTTHSPLLSSSTAIRRFVGTGTSGGTLTISAGSTLIFSEEHANFAGNVTLAGDTPTCGNCNAVGRSNVYIINNATLTLKPGSHIWAHEYWGFIWVGNYSTPGHIRIEGGATVSEYPYVGTRGLILAGASGNLSSLYMDGANVSGGENNVALGLVINYEIKKLDRFRTGHNFSSGGMFSIVRIENCATSVFTDTSWDGMDWYSAPADINSSINISVNGSGCPNITLTGSGGMYGPSLADDPNGILTW